MNIAARTKICMVIGDPVEHSLSPKMHNAGYKALGIDNEFVYVGAHVKPENLPDFAKGIRAMQIRGVSVTIPHKQEIMKYLDEIDETAKKIGAVNTVTIEDGVLTGYNTDWLGVVNSLEKVTSLSGKKALVLGAGGAAKAAAYGLIKKDAIVTIINRTLGNAKSLAEEFECDFAELSDIEVARDMDIIVNVSSIGMHPNENESLVPKNLISKNQVVLDAVYHPYETLLLKNAKEQEAQVIHGTEMLLQQGMAQFKIYTGHEAPENVMRDVLLENLKK